MSFQIDTISIDKIVTLIKEVSEKYLTSEDAQAITVKGDSNFVTKVDTNIEQAMKEQLRTLYPDIQFMGEEEDNSDVDFSKPFWILDPVDGTSNLIHDFRNSCMSLALAVDKEPVIGIIYHFFTGEVFSAVKGKGAYVNQRPICVSPITELSRSLVTFGTSPYDKTTMGEQTMEFVKKLFFLCEDIRRLGSAAIDLANVACGRTEIFLEKNLKPWDFAAGIILVQESGGIVTNFQGEKIDITKPSDILAGNPTIHEKIKMELP